MNELKKMKKKCKIANECINELITEFGDYNPSKMIEITEKYEKDFFELETIEDVKITTLKIFEINGKTHTIETTSIGKFDKVNYKLLE